ncbi:methyltransferase domain-containing protein [Psychroflexus planctonicus]|uniref:Methyltransferase domain-containing protein n=1 Tax=Psychroflexus planctonicus TaxID=1526575 RepID=A0ABQ1SF94_9FLAO|nr:methyltransferase domain-containing protein [Psychroflexus planctonicus]GGE28545.1 hypothetical protein GCM10010832_06510 [Psychroflexus planctonicus]
MQLVSTRHRSLLPEIMDEFDFDGKELEKVLKNIDQINVALGGNRVTIDGIQQFIRQHPQEEYTIVDVGCGSGASLRKLAKWAKNQPQQFQFIGIDANPECIRIAQKASKEIENLNFECMNVFSTAFEKIQVDVFISTLTMHHFKDKELLQLMKRLQQQAKIGMVINDLQRSKTAYYLFKLYGLFFIRSKIAKHDGLISILRGFKKTDFNNYAEKMNVQNHQIKWFWAFRYQWIIQNK